jgi:hypothetical protein
MGAWRRRRRRVARLAPMRQDRALGGRRNESARVSGWHVSAAGGRGRGALSRCKCNRVAKKKLTYCHQAYNCELVRAAAAQDASAAFGPRHSSQHALQQAPQAFDNVDDEDDEAAAGAASEFSNR